MVSGRERVGGIIQPLCFLYRFVFRAPVALLLSSASVAADKPSLAKVTIVHDRPSRSAGVFASSRRTSAWHTSLRRHQQARFFPRNNSKSSRPDFVLASRSHLTLKKRTAWHRVIADV